MVNKHYPRAPMDRRSFMRATGAAALTMSFYGCGRRSSSVEGSVIVVGAGLSGLSAAMLLEERGIDVTVVEARDRLGGRIMTLDDVPGRPEGGGPVISESYERIMRIARAVDAEMVPMGPYEKDTLFHINDQSVSADAWPMSAANRLPEALRQLPPSFLLATLTSPDNPLTDSGDWINARHKSIDISLAEYLRSKGVDEESLRLINVAPNTNDIETTSALWALRNAQRRRDSKGGRLLTTAGGNTRLIEKMGGAVRAKIHLGKPVASIRSADTHVRVTSDDGETFDGDFCVVTVPFSVLRNIEIEPALEGLQLEAVNKLPYTAINKYNFVPRHAFWEEDGLPVAMWTDTFIERVFPNRDSGGNMLSLTCWVDGANAIDLDAVSLDEQVATVQAELERIRPATKGALDPVRSVSWGRDPFALGAYAHYAPGQVTTLKPVMAEPWKRLHFAGEHTAITSPGIESAVESAQRASKEILRRLS